MSEAKFAKMVEMTEESGNRVGGYWSAAVQVNFEYGRAVLGEGDDGLVGNEREIVKLEL